MIFPRTYSYPKIVAYAVAACVMAALAARPSRGRIVLMAAVIAAAFLLRHDHGLYIGVASAACLALARLGERRARVRSSQPWRQSWLHSRLPRPRSCCRGSCSSR